MPWRLPILLYFILQFGVLPVIAQNDSPLKNIDTTIVSLDSAIQKDSLIIQYVPIIPRRLLIADAPFLQMHFPNYLDSGYSVLVDYKKYFADLHKGFQLYTPPLFPLKEANLVFRIEQRFALPDKDSLFYAILLLLFLYAFVANMYPQYFPKLFSQFNHSSLRILQNREQLLQNSLASLLMNMGFIASFSFMATLVIFNQHLLALSFWEGYLYITIFITCLYIGKYLCLQLVAYTFHAAELVQTYLFVVFLINKVLGILLLPFILLIAFAKTQYYPYAMYGAGALAILLLLYRYLFSLTTVRNKLHISSFHFFLYLCAFEILPLLILYKLIVQYLGGTY